MSILGVGHYLDETGGINLTSLLILCAVFGFTGSFISLFMSKFIAKRTTGTRIIAQPRTADEQWLVSIVDELARKANIKFPEEGIFAAAQAKAFATGLYCNAALVSVSEGMLQRFDREEVRAVMAYVICNVDNCDMVILTLVLGVVNSFVMFFARIIGHTVDRVVFKIEFGHDIGFWVNTIVAQMPLAILASMIVMAFS